MNAACTADLAVVVGRHEMCVLDVHLTQPAVPIDTELEMGRLPATCPAGSMVLVVPAMIRFVAPVDGVYTLEWSIDDSPPQTVPMIVRVGTPQDPDQPTD